ncbi:MAG: hypothetical protein JJV88_00230 [Sulfurovum sp.]|nr:hypothetical protein [Sulfurovaceae bacterium]
MAEYTSNFTGAEIDNKLGKVGAIEAKGNDNATRIDNYSYNDIADKPTTITAQQAQDITDNKNDKHTHSNALQLNKFSENAEGKILYDGNIVKVVVEDVVNSDSAINALSAKQGKLINAKAIHNNRAVIDKFTQNAEGKVLYDNSEIGGVTVIYDGLDSTSATDGLSAKQGKIVNDEVIDLTTRADNLDTKTNTTQQQATTNKDDIATLNSKTDTTNNEANTLKNRVDGLNTKTNDTNTNVSNLVTKTDNTNTEVTDLKTRADGTESNVTDLQNDKENNIVKKTGFNLDKSDSLTLDDSTQLATSKAVKLVNDKAIDFEEGSWTPTLTYSDSVVAYSRQQGKYIKVGNQVTLWFDLIITSHSASNTQAKIAGIPIVPSVGANGAGYSVCHYRDCRMLKAEFRGRPSSSWISKTSEIYINGFDSRNNQYNITANDLEDGRLTGTITYNTL